MPKQVYDINHNNTVSFPQLLVGIPLNYNNIHNSYILI